MTKHKFNMFFMILFVGTGISMSWGANADSLGDLRTALNNAHNACSDVSDKLSDMKRMAGIGTAATAVGTVGGGVALGAGIAKAKTDKKIADAMAPYVQQNREKATTQADEFSAVPNIGRNRTNESESTASLSNEDLDKLREKSKTLGDVRTGSMAVAGVSDAVGSVVASKNTSQDDLEAFIKKCSDAVKTVESANMQVRTDGSDTEGNYSKRAANVVSKCKQLNNVDISSVTGKAKGAMVSGLIGTTTGLVGTVVSAIANSKSVRSVDADRQKEKNLNTTSNVLAGATTVASATSTVFNATQISAIKKISAIAEECEGAF